MNTAPAFNYARKSVTLVALTILVGTFMTIVELLNKCVTSLRGLVAADPYAGEALSNLLDTVLEAVDAMEKVQETFTETADAINKADTYAETFVCANCGERVPVQHWAAHLDDNGSMECLNARGPGLYNGNVEVFARGVLYSDGLYEYILSDQGQVVQMDRRSGEVVLYCSHAEWPMSPVGSAKRTCGSCGHDVSCYMFDEHETQCVLDAMGVEGTELVREGGW